MVPNQPPTVNLTYTFNRHMSRKRSRQLDGGRESPDWEGVRAGASVAKHYSKVNDDPEAKLAAEEKQEEDRLDAAHPHTVGFDIPFRAAFVGETGSGKTFTLTHQLLSDDASLKGRFRKIIIFSTTLSADPVWHRIYWDGAEDVIHFENFDDRIVGRIYQEQDEIFQVARHLAEPILIVIDDNAYTTREALNHANLDKVYYRGRHRDISVVHLVQKLEMLSPVQRNQLSNMLVWGTANKKSLDSVHEQMGSLIDKPVFQQIFLDIVGSQDFNFMHCRKARKGGYMQIWNGIDDCVIENVSAMQASIMRGRPSAPDLTQSTLLHTWSQDDLPEEDS